jgi:hypothetical protein
LNMITAALNKIPVRLEQDHLWVEHRHSRP